MEVDMDNKDIKIINHLIKNARINASAISQHIKLSTSAVIDRIKKLESSGVITGYTVLLDPRKIHLDVTAIINIVMEHPKYNDKFVEAVTNNKNVTECYYIAGDYDYYLKVITANTSTLQDILNDIKRLEGVAKTKTSIVLQTPKNEYSISADFNED
jgi:Lrp/AsnC family transcriptional regulator, leucine-responsive regulatory protein